MEGDKMSKLYRITTQDIDNLESFYTKLDNWRYDAMMAGEMEKEQKYSDKMDEIIALQQMIDGANRVFGNAWARIKELSAEREMLRDQVIAELRI